MTDHYCRTGYHDQPAYGCYSHHGCRCDGCRTAKVQVNRLQRAGRSVTDVRTRRQVDVPARPWRRIVKALEAKGVTVDEWLWGLSDRLERTVI